MTIATEIICTVHSTADGSTCMYRSVSRWVPLIAFISRLLAQPRVYLLTRVRLTVKKVERLEDSKCIRNTRDKDHDVHDLVARAKDIEAAGEPLLRELSWVIHDKHL